MQCVRGSSRVIGTVQGKRLRDATIALRAPPLAIAGVCFAQCETPMSAVREPLPATLPGRSQPVKVKDALTRPVG